MREIAKKLETGPSSLYRHMANKRELWFAILTDYFKEFTLEMEQLATSHQGSAIDLLLKIGHFFLQFAKEDFLRFKLMFLTEPPTSNKEKGIYENLCNPTAFKSLIDIVQNVIDENKLKANAILLANSVWALVLGASTITSPINDYLFDQNLQNTFSVEDYTKHIFEAINKIIFN